MPTYSYSDGTISIAGGSAALTGIGTAWSTQVRAGDEVAALIAVAGGGSPTPFHWVPVGWVSSVDSDIAITLLDTFEGDDLVSVQYRIIRGIAHLAGAAPVETMVEFMELIEGQGLNGSP